MYPDDYAKGHAAFAKAKAAYKDKYGVRAKDVMAMNTAYNISECRKKERVTLLELKENIVGEIPARIQDEELWQVLRGKALGDDDTYTAIAMVLGVQYDILYRDVTITGKEKAHIDNTPWGDGGGGWCADEVSRENSRTFARNCDFWSDEKGLAEGQVFSSRYITQHVGELLKEGREIVRPEYIEDLLRMFNLKGDAERLTMPGRCIYGYPKLAVNKDGTVNKDAFAFNLRWTMRAHLWTTNYISAKIGTPTESILLYMGGIKGPATVKTVFDVALKLGIPAAKLLGTNEGEYKLSKEPDNATTAKAKIDENCFWRSFFFSMKIEKRLKKLCQEAGDDIGDKRLEIWHKRVGGGLGLATIINGQLTCGADYQDPTIKKAIPQIAGGLGIPENQLTDWADGFTISEAEELRRDLISQVLASTNPNELACLNELADLLLKRPVPNGLPQA